MPFPVGARLTLIELLQQRASEQHDQRLYTFLDDAGDEEGSLTFGELERQARAIGSLLQSRSVAGERVLLLYPPGLQYIAGFMGCLFSGAFAVPAYPPDPARLERTLPRLLSI